jgi:hypothetical protein
MAMKITHTGTHKTAAALAQALRDEGLEVEVVELRSPMKRRGGGPQNALWDFILNVTLTVAAEEALEAAAKRGIEAFKKKYPALRAQLESTPRHARW